MEGLGAIRELPRGVTDEHIKEEEPGDHDVDHRKDPDGDWVLRAVGAVEEVVAGECLLGEEEERLIELVKARRAWVGLKLGKRGVVDAAGGLLVQLDKGAAKGKRHDTQHRQVREHVLKHDEDHQRVGTKAREDEENALQPQPAGRRESGRKRAQ